MEAGYLNTAKTTWITGIQVYFVTAVCSDILFIPTSNSSALQTGNTEYSAPQVIFNLISRGSTWLQGCCLESLSLPDKGPQREILSSYFSLEHERSSLVQHKAKGKLGARLKLSHFSNYCILVCLLLLRETFGEMSITQQAFNLQAPPKLTREYKWGPAKQIWALQNEIHAHFKRDKAVLFCRMFGFFWFQRDLWIPYKEELLDSFWVLFRWKKFKVTFVSEGEGRAINIMSICSANRRHQSNESCKGLKGKKIIQYFSIFYLYCAFLESFLLILQRLPLIFFPG